MKRLLMSAVVLVVGMVVGMVGITAVPASAGEPDPALVGGATGAGWVGGVEASYTPRELADAAAKKELWHAYLAMGDGRMSADAFERVELRVGRELGLDLRGDRLAAARSVHSCPPGEPCERVILGVRHRGQVTNYHCGPATGAMMAAYLNRPRSAHNGARLTQFTLGGDAHMRTNRNKVTAYASKLFTTGLNRWVDGRSRGRYAQVDAPSVRTFRGASTHTITSGRPFAIGTVELVGERSYNFHDNRREPVGHWVVARGYSRFGNSTHLLDPATTVWAQTRARIKRPTKRFVSKYVDNGISA